MQLHFYHVTNMHSTDYVVAKCLSVHLSHASILCEMFIHILKVFLTMW